jgi:hypothetical protein
VINEGERVVENFFPYRMDDGGETVYSRTNVIFSDNYYQSGSASSLTAPKKFVTQKGRAI